MIPVYRKAITGVLAAAFALTVTGSALAPAIAAEPGITDTEILLGGPRISAT